MLPLASVITLDCNHARLVLQAACCVVSNVLSNLGLPDNLEKNREFKSQFCYNFARKDISSDESLQQGRNRSRELNFSPYKPILAVLGMAHVCTLPSFLPPSFNFATRTLHGSAISNFGVMHGLNDHMPPLTLPCLFALMTSFVGISRHQAMHDHNALPTDHQATIQTTNVGCAVVIACSGMHADARQG